MMARGRRSKKEPCTVCKKVDLIVSDSDDNEPTSWVQCNLCDLWSHAACLNISPDFYAFLCDGYNEYVKVQIQCPACLSSNSELQTQTPRLPLVHSNSAFDLTDNSENHDDNVASIENNYRLVYGYRDVMSNMFQFDFWYNGVLFNSVEHCYQFLKARYQKNFLLAEQVRRAKSSIAAKKLSRQLRDATDAERESARNLMKRLLREKFNQCAPFRDELRKSGANMLIHSTYAKDTFWASGLRHDQPGPIPSRLPGKNVMGCILMELREEMNNGSLKPRIGRKQNQQPRAKPVVCFHCQKVGHKRMNCHFYNSVSVNSNLISSYHPGGRVSSKISNGFGGNVRDYSSFPAVNMRRRQNNVASSSRRAGNYSHAVKRPNFDFNVNDFPALNDVQLNGRGNFNPFINAAYFNSNAFNSGRLGNLGPNQMVPNNFGYGQPPPSYLSQPNPNHIPLLPNQPAQVRLNQPPQGQLNYNPALYGGFVSDENAYVAPFDYLDSASYPFLGQSQAVPPVTRQQA